MTDKVSYYADDSIIQQTEITDVTQHVLQDPYDYLEIDKCTKFITSANFKTVCLQFPDSLLNYANFVSTELEQNTNLKCCVLADTSYGSCCVDEVAAEHMNADAIIHFGHSCLSPTEKLPILYVFGKSLLCLDSLLQNMGTVVTANDHILMFYDVCFHYIVMSSKKKLIESYPNLVMSFLPIDKENFIETSTKCFGRMYNLKDELSSYKIIYIGEESLTLNNLILKFNKNPFYSYSPEKLEIRKEGLTVNKFLMKRFYLIEKAKNSQIVGIVIGTLGVAKYKELLERIKTVLKKAGKKFYVFVVGKVNVPKMANFMEIDIFVFIACPENSLIDSKEYYKPIVTPYEIEVACLTTREWTGEYVTEFGDLLHGASHYVDLAEEDENDDDIPEYSFITGKMNSSKISNTPEHSTELALRSDETNIACIQPQNALDYYSSRTWQGLNSSDSSSEMKLAHDGRSGIAMRYEGES